MTDLNDISLFVQVVRAGSFAAAGRRLGIPPNTLSRRIQALETQIGVRLLQRSTRQLALTPAGTTLFQGSAEQIDAVEAVARETAEGGEHAVGKVRVAAAADFFRWFDVTWVGDFLAAHPKVRLEFVLGDDKVDLIEQGIDVAIRSGVDPDSNLVARQVGTTRATLVASPAYVASHGRPESLQALAQHECIAAPTPTGLIEWRLIGPDGATTVAVTGRFHANALRVQLDAALAGLGIALLPTLVTAEHLRAGQLLEVLPQYGTPGVGVYVVYASRRQSPKAVTAFIDFVMTRMVEARLLDPLPKAGNGG
jgi:DNA-binding transcriptional LysR family regulator